MEKSNLPLRTEHAWVGRTVENGLAQFVFRESGDPVASGSFLGRTDFDKEVAARFQISSRLLHKPDEHLETVAAAVEGLVRLVITNAGGQARNFLAWDVGRVAEDEVETLSGGDRRKQIALKEAYPLGNAVMLRIALRHPQRLGADIY